MGDRALIIFRHQRDGKAIEYGPTVYLHWNGYQVIEWLREFKETLMKGRTTDLPYVSARFIGFCHDKIPGNLSLGVWNTNIPRRGIDKPAFWKNESHGDSGVFLITLPYWDVEQFGSSDNDYKSYGAFNGDVFANTLNMNP